MFKNYFQGSLFAQDLLDSSIAEFPEWEAYGDPDLASFESEVQLLFDRFPTDGKPNETQTEDDLIWPVLRLLGWTESLRQQNLSAKGREDVPDGLLFADAAAKDRANQPTLGNGSGTNTASPSSNPSDGTCHSTVATRTRPRLLPKCSATCAGQTTWPRANCAGAYSLMGHDGGSITRGRVPSLSSSARLISC